MLTTIIVIGIIYLSCILFIGWWAGRQQKSNAEDYFLASRSLGVVVLVMTQAATVFSAFTFYGLPGSAYSSGMGLLGGLCVGTIASSFMYYIIGYRAWLIGQKYRWMTPPEVAYERFGSKRVRDVFLLVNIIFVMPYLVMQPVGAGQALTGLTNGAIPYYVGSTLITFLIIFYVFYSGMRGVALTDTLQGLVMLSFSWIALFFVAAASGGFADIFDKLLKSGALARGAGYWTWQVSFSWAFLIVVNQAMQPQIFVRFLCAKNVDTFRKSFAIYPLLAFSTFPIIFVGLMSKVLIPALKAPDQALAVALTTFAPPIMVGIFAAAGMAAMMSTADSQLLVIGSMFSRDFYKAYLNPTASSHKEFWVARIFIVVFALLAWILSFKPPTLLITLGAAAFTGIAVLTPTGLAMFYWKRVTAPAAIVSIVLGEMYVLGFYLKLIPNSWNIGFLPVVPAVFVATVALIVVSLFTAPPEEYRVSRYFNLFERVFGGSRRENAA